jgi:hypothetical protein
MDFSAAPCEATVARLIVSKYTIPIAPDFVLLACAGHTRANATTVEQSLSGDIQRSLTRTLPLIR